LPSHHPLTLQELIGFLSLQRDDGEEDEETDSAATKPLAAAMLSDVHQAATLSELVTKEQRGVEPLWVATTACSGGVPRHSGIEAR
jgi:hypothetical protein